MVERTLIRPPSSRLGPLKPAERKTVMEASPVYGVYEETIDRKSAFEILSKRAEDKAAVEAEAEEEKKRAKGRGRRAKGSDYRGDDLAPMWQEEGEFRSARRYNGDTPKPKKTKARRSNRQTVGEAVMKSFARSVSSSLGRKVARGILGGLFSGR